MSAQDHLRSGDIDAALTALQAEVRANPADAKLRVFLFQLLCVQGDWARAVQQLKTTATLHPQAESMAQTYRTAIICERHRMAVFAGEIAPHLPDTAPNWLTVLWEALQKEAAGEEAGAATLRSYALKAAPATAGRINGTEFQWIADADDRLGPVLEVILNGQYTWLPFADIAALSCEGPQDLRDLIWTPATLQLVDGSEHVALIPTRYPATLAHGTQAEKLARATAWLPHPSGQRVFVTDSEELALLELRHLQLDQPSTARSAKMTEQQDG